MTEMNTQIDLLAEKILDGSTMLWRVEEVWI